MGISIEARCRIAGGLSSGGARWHKHWVDDASCWPLSRARCVALHSFYRLLLIFTALLALVKLSLGLVERFFVQFEHFRWIWDYFSPLSFVIWFENWYYSFQITGLAAMFESLGLILKFLLNKCRVLWWILKFTDVLASPSCLVLIKLGNRFNRASVKGVASSIGSWMSHDMCRFVWIRRIGPYSIIELEFSLGHLNRHIWVWRLVSRNSKRFHSIFLR